MQAAKELNLTVYSLTYERVTMLEMGDCLGGWRILTDRGDYAAITSDVLIAYMKNKLQP